MKTVRFFILFLFMGIVSMAALSAQTKQEKREQKAQMIKELVMSQKYKIEVHRALPLRGRAVTLTSPYALEIRHDSVISYLPYYGRAYSIPYGGGNGLNFKAPITGYQVKWNKKGAAKIEFTARNSEDRFDFYIDLFDNGSSTIAVNMQNRQSISFEGNLDVKE